MPHQGVGSFTGDFVARHNKTYTLSLFYTEEVTSPDPAITCILQVTLLTSRRVPESEAGTAIRLPCKYFARDAWGPLVAADHSRPDGSRIQDIQAVSRIGRRHCHEHPDGPSGKA